MSRLAALVRLRRWEIDEKRRALAALAGLKAKLEMDLAALAAELKAEQATAAQAAEVSFAYAGFASSIRRREAKVGESIASVDARLDAAQSEVTDAFQELKRVEIAHDRQVAEVRAAQDRREQAESDEIAQRQHRR